jgi:hypothetical protein
MDVLWPARLVAPPMMVCAVMAAPIVATPEPRLDGDVLVTAAQHATPPDTDPTPVRQVVDDYVGLYTKEALVRWRALFLPTFTATSPAADGGVTVRTLDEFYDAQARGFARAAEMSETLEDVVVERSGRIGTARAGFVFRQDGMARRGRLVLTLVERAGAWKIATLLFSY